MYKTIYNPALKETVTFVHTAEQTQGTFSLLEISLEVGGGNPMHLHRSYSERFTAIKGTLGMELEGGKKIYLQPNESFFVEKGVPHRFFNPTNDEITFSNRVEPGSTGLEQTLQILAGLAADGKYTKSNVPSNLFHLAICGKLSDMRLTGIAGLLTTPIIHVLALIADKIGIRKKLLKQYVGLPNTETSTAISSSN